MTDCLFCQIAAKRIDAVILYEYEDDDLLAFLDIGPIRDGHAQVIPKKHYETFEVLPPELAQHLMVDRAHRERIRNIIAFDGQ